MGGIPPVSTGPIGGGPGSPEPNIEFLSPSLPPSGGTQPSNITEEGKQKLLEALEYSKNHIPPHMKVPLAFFKARGE